MLTGLLKLIFGTKSQRDVRRMLPVVAKINRIEEELQTLTDEELQAKFKADPISAVEQLLGVDLPNDTIEKIVDGIKAKIAIDDIGDALGKLGGLFGKKK